MQRVTRAAVSVGGTVVSSIGPGLCLLVGVETGDEERDLAVVVGKIAGLRIFGDDEGKMNRGIDEVGGEILIVSQFTLLGDVRKGRRPSFTAAAPPARAGPLVDAMAAGFRAKGISTAQGVFGARMEVELVNDGPVTLLVDVRSGRVG